MDSSATNKKILLILLLVSAAFVSVISFSPSVEAACAQGSYCSTYYPGWRYYVQSNCYSYWLDYCQYGCSSGSCNPSLCQYSNGNYANIGDKLCYNNAAYSCTSGGWSSSSCQYGCSSGQCVQANCDGYSVGASLCWSSDGQARNSWYCQSHNNWQIANCNYGCSNGQCNSPPTPKPVLVGISQPSEIKVGETAAITITYRNDGGPSDNAYISPSFSSDADVVDYYGGLPVEGPYGPNYPGKTNVWDSNGNLIPARSTLVDFHGSFPAGSTKSFTVKIKPKQVGTTWFKVRAALSDGNKYYRDPSSGTTDQQGWYAREYSITVKPNTYTIIAKTNEANTQIKIGNSVMCTTQWYWWDASCEFTATDSQTITANKDGFISDPAQVTVSSGQTITFKMNPASYASVVNAHANYVNVYRGSEWKCSTGSDYLCKADGLAGSETLTAKKAGYEDKQFDVSYSNRDASIYLNQLFKINNLSLSKNPVFKKEKFTTYTKVDQAYMTDLGWGNKEGKIRITLTADGQTTTKEFVNSCNFLSCILYGAWNYLTGGWEVSLETSIQNTGNKAVGVIAEDLYAGTSAQASASITVNESPKPKPTLVSLNYKSEISETDIETVTVKYRNDGGDAYGAYFSPSFDNNWDITDYYGDLPSKQLYKKDYYPIWTNQNTQQKTADYPLIDFWGSWASGETKSFTIKLSPKTPGQIFFNSRVALCDTDWNCFRDPGSGDTDQQGWYVNKRTVQVKSKDYTLTLSSNENSVRFSTNTGKSCLAVGTSCSITLVPGDYTITADKVIILASTGNDWMLDPTNEWLPETRGIRIISSSQENFQLVKKLVLSATSDKAAALKGETVTLTTTLKNIQSPDTKITVSLIDTGIFSDSTLWTQTQDAQSQNTFKIQVPLYAEKDVHIISVRATDPKDSRRSAAIEKDLSVDQPEIVADFQISDIKYKSCAGPYSSIVCKDTTLKTQNPSLLTQNPVIWGGSSVEIKYDIKNFGSCNQQGCGYSGRFYAIAPGTYPRSETTKEIYGDSKDATGTADLYLLPYAQADKINAEVSGYKKDLAVQIIPDPAPEITDISLCLDSVDPNGVCGIAVGKISENTYGPVYAGAQIGLYFKAKGLYRYGRSFGKVNLKLQVNKQGIVFENKDTIDSSSEDPHKVWAFSVPTEIDTKDLTIKIEDPSDWQTTEKTIKIKIAEPPKNYVPVKHPFQFKSGSFIDYDSDRQKAELKASVDELANLLNDNSLSQEDRDYVKNSLFSISIITSQIPELSNTEVIQGGTYRSDTWFDAFAGAISGFTSSVKSFVSGAANWIGEKAGEAVDWVKGAGSWVIDKASKGIDSFIQDPLGTTFNAIKSTAQNIYNIGAGIGGWVMEHPWESLAIVGLAALTLTGIGAVAGAAGLGALSGLGSVGSALFTAELVGTGALLTYKTASGTLDGNDVLMGALSLGPLTVVKAFQLTGITAKLAPQVRNSLSRLSDAIGQSSIKQKIGSAFSKFTNVAGNAAKKVEGIFEEKMLPIWIKGTKPHLDPNLAGKLDELWALHKAGMHGALGEIKNAKNMIENDYIFDLSKRFGYADKLGIPRQIEVDAIGTDARGIKIVREVKSVDPNKFVDKRDMERWLSDKIEERVGRIMEAKGAGVPDLQYISRIEFSIPKAAMDNIDFMTLFAKDVLNLEKQYGIALKIVPL